MLIHDATQSELPYLVNFLFLREENKQAKFELLQGLTKWMYKEQLMFVELLLEIGALSLEAERVQYRDRHTKVTMVP
jgi:hypothetical protein